jgi:hypothetical protein
MSSITLRHPARPLLAMLALLLLAACHDTPTTPSDPVVGTYELVADNITFTVMYSPGDTARDLFAEGERMTLTLHDDHSVDQTVHFPATMTGFGDQDLRASGRWTRNGDVISMLPLDPGPGQAPTLLTVRGDSLVSHDTASNAIVNVAYVRR